MTEKKSFLLSIIYVDSHIYDLNARNRGAFFFKGENTFYDLRIPCSQSATNKELSKRVSMRCPFNVQQVMRQAANHLRYHHEHFLIRADSNLPPSTASSIAKNKSRKTATTCPASILAFTSALIFLSCFMSMPGTVTGSSLVRPGDGAFSAESVPESARMQAG